MQSPRAIMKIKSLFKKIVYVDIDSTICKCLDDSTHGSTYKTPDYKLCSPYPNRIKKINKL